MDTAVVVGLVLVLLMFIIYLCLIKNSITSGFAAFNYLLCVVILGIIGIGVFSCLMRREEIHPDRDMVLAIQ